MQKLVNILRWYYRRLSEPIFLAAVTSGLFAVVVEFLFQDHGKWDSQGASDPLYKLFHFLASPTAGEANPIPDLAIGSVLFGTVLALFVSLWTLVRTRADQTPGAPELSELKDISRRISDLDTRHSEKLRAELGSITNELTELRGEIANYQIQTTGWEKIFQTFLRRMDREKNRLRGASIVNLLLGLFFSTLALYLIGQLVLSPPDLSPGNSSALPNSWLFLSQRLLPRISLGLLIQLVGFFFLRLYVANELDLKHTKNELTNFDAWMIGVLLAKDSADSASLRAVIERMCSVERNFVLRKGERTVGVEGDIKYNDLTAFLKEMLDRLPAVFNSNDKPKKADDHG
ncbi:MAG: hypothetical protein ABSD74_12695 [Rhizomicrobium sp.]